MKTLSALLLSVLLFVAVPAHAQTDKPKNLLLNGDFSRGVEDWDVITGHRGTVKVVDVTAEPFRKAVSVTAKPHCREPRRGS